MTARIPDVNGWYEIKRNPLSMAGVFPYTKQSVQYPGWENDPNGIIQVYRPESELADPETVDSFRLLPWTNGHTMLGNPDMDPNLTPPEVKGVHGTTGDHIEYDPTDRTLYGNIKLWSSSLADAIDAGKKDLSMGFRCVYEFVSGIFEGLPFQAIQRNIRGNHKASVDHGRMGPGVAVQDQCLTFALDASELREIKAMKVTRRVKISSKLGVAPGALAAAMGMDSAPADALKIWNAAMDAEEDDGEGDGDAPKAGMTLEEIADMLGEVGPSLAKINEALAGMAGAPPDADSDVDPEVPAVDDDMEPVLDEFGKQKMGADGKPMMAKKAPPAVVADKGLAACDAAIATLKIQSKTIHKALGTRTVPPALSAMDAAIKTCETNRAKIGRKVMRRGGNGMDTRLAVMDAAIKQLQTANPVRAAMDEIAKRDVLANKVSAFVGTFDHSVMTELDVATYAAKKFGLDAAPETAIASVKAYLHNRSPEPAPPAAKAWGLDAAAKPTGKISALIAGVPVAKAA